MSESYVEHLVARKPSKGMKAIEVAAIVFTVFFGLLYFLSFSWIPLISAVVFGVMAYIASKRIDIEYEYLYIDKSLSVDRIFNKEKRKHVADFEVDKMEILAPKKSYHLDEYKNRELKTIDYSSLKEDSNPYVFIYENNQRIIFEPTEEMVKLIKNVAPRKVFMD